MPSIVTEALVTGSVMRPWTVRVIRTRSGCSSGPSTHARRTSIPARSSDSDALISTVSQRTGPGTSWRMVPTACPVWVPACAGKRTIWVRLTPAEMRAARPRATPNVAGGKMAALFLVLAVADAVLLGDAVLGNTSASSVSVFDHSVTGFTQGQLLVVAAGLGLLLALLPGLAWSWSRARRAKRLQLRSGRPRRGRGLHRASRRRTVVDTRPAVVAWVPSYRVPSLRRPFQSGACRELVAVVGAVLSRPSPEIVPVGEVEVGCHRPGQEQRSLQERLEVGDAVDVDLPPPFLEAVHQFPDPWRPPVQRPAAHPPRMQRGHDLFGQGGGREEQGTKDIDGD